MALGVEPVPLIARRSIARRGHAPPPAILRPVLEVQSIGKSFPAVRALDGVSLRVAAGEVHGVIGENGAGKSTLMKILAGIERPDEGRLVLDGRPYAPRSAREATDACVAMIHQELNLAGALSAAENIVLGREPRRWGFIRRAAMRAEATRRLAEVGASIDPDAIVGDLPVAQQQLVEIAKALSQESKVLILDEPTAVLSERETRRLFELVRRLAAAGTAIVYISHLLPEVRALCDRISVLRDGRLVAETTPEESDTDRLASLMVGRELADVFPPRSPRPVSAARIAVSGAAVAGHVHEASFEIAPGEILGLAGLVGSGRTELAEAVAGIRPLRAGAIALDGAAVRFGRRGRRSTAASPTSARIARAAASSSNSRARTTSPCRISRHTAGSSRTVAARPRRRGRGSGRSTSAARTRRRRCARSRAAISRSSRSRAGST